jgi:hypothetical protein
MAMISMPTYPPAPRTVDWILNDVVASVISPFSGQQQIQDWQAGWVEASVSMPPMTHANAQAWAAFFMACRGMANTFMFGDPLAVAPRGTGTGTPTVAGASQSGFALNTAGWTGTLPVLKAGDFIQIGSRLYRVLVDATQSGGNATLSIWPQLRESPNDGATIILNNTQGTFRMKSNTRKFSVTEARFYGFQFDIREAI